MLLRQVVLLESHEINLSKTIYKELSYEARDAIEGWEFANWAGGKLESHFENSDEVAQEIVEAFSKVRDYLKQKYGNTILLYRGMKAGGSINPRVLQSWTSDKKVAEHFAGLRTSHWKSLLQKELTDKEIEKAIEYYNKNGFVTFYGRKFIKNKNDPQYYNMYDKHREFITDGDDLESDFKSMQQSRSEYNQNLLDNAIVLEEEIPIDRIVWITNNLDSKEFIVKVL